MTEIRQKYNNPLLFLEQEKFSYKANFGYYEYYSFNISNLWLKFKKIYQGSNTL